MSSYLRNNSNTHRKKSRIILCTNCGSRRHEYKQCSEPVTSWGVILVSYGNLQKPVHSEHIDLLNNELIDSQKRVLIESNADRMIVSNAYYNIMFLMISRKHSVGYVEFIRGRYRPEKIDQVIYLFKQMMQNEIDKIKHSLTLDDGFEYLWKDFWDHKHDSPYLMKDKTTSKCHYDMLKYRGVDGPELDLGYIVSTVNVDYDIEEWGFPKGRRNKFESEEECALREFKEESGYTDDDIKIISEIEPLVEEFIGTNGVNYRHIYYVAELVSGKRPRNNITESQRDEIGNIQFMDFHTALECIRDYHVPRKILLEKLFTYYLDKLVVSNRNAVNEILINNENQSSDQTPHTGDVNKGYEPDVDQTASNDTNDTNDTNGVEAEEQGYEDSDIEGTSSDETSPQLDNGPKLTTVSKEGSVIIIRKSPGQKNNSVASSN